jgi:hypothetical protein
MAFEPSEQQKSLFIIRLVRCPNRNAPTNLAYGISLIPSRQLFIHRRDIFRKHVLNLSAALRFLIRARPAIRLQSQRRKLQRQLRSLLAAYDAATPRSPAF